MKRNLKDFLIALGNTHRVHGGKESGPCKKKKLKLPKTKPKDLKTKFLKIP